MNNVFLKIDGITGESKDSVHQGWIDVGRQMEYYRITLESVIVIEVLLNEGGSMTDVEYEFQADKVKFQHWEQCTSGVKGAETRMGWNIKESDSYF